MATGAATTKPATTADSNSRPIDHP